MKASRWIILGTIAALSVVLYQVAGKAEEAKQPPQEFQLRQVPEQVVLYTIVRGPYDALGPAIGKLFALAGQKGLMPPRGPLQYAYLNNPQLVSSAHWLTEIRIPVSKEALKAAGTLGEMTDVKTLPALQVVVAVKPEGQADPGPIYQALMEWVGKKGYRAVEGPFEIFLTNAQSNDYARMKTEIMVPIQKPAPPAASSPSVK